MGRKIRKPSEHRTACAMIFFSVVENGGAEKVDELDGLVLPDPVVPFEEGSVLERSRVNVPEVRCCTMVAAGSEEEGRVVDSA